MLKKPMILATMSLALSAGSAYAHSPVDMVLTGGPSAIRLLDGNANLTWNGNGATAIGSVIGGPNSDHYELFGYFFDVTSAGSLDIYTSDYDDIWGETDLYVYKYDGTHDWQIQPSHWTQEAPRPDALSPINIFGVSITGFVPGVPGTGASDAGIRSHFDTGSYLAIVATGALSPGDGRVMDFATADNTYLSSGFTSADAFYGNPEEFTPGQEIGRPNGVTHDFYIRLSPNSTAAISAPAAVPVPGAVWLMGSILAGFGTLGRRKSAKA